VLKAVLVQGVAVGAFTAVITVRTLL
jgi:hypothetical protein